MPEDIFYFKESDIPVRLPEIPRAVFQPVRECLISGKILEIEYESLSDDTLVRQVFPEVLFRSGENWYIAAYCLLRDEPRTFCLDRILSAKDTGVRHDPFDIAEDFRANGIPWKRRESPAEDPDGKTSAPEWHRIELSPCENTPEYHIPPPDPEWERKAALRGFCNDLVEHAGQGDLERMSEDIAAGADVNYQEGGTTPLMAAAGRGHVEAARFLIEHGADPEKRGRTTRTVLNEAARFGRMDMIRYLVEELKLPVCQQDYFGWSPAFCAVQNRCFDALRYFLEHGADPNLPDRDGRTPLMEVFDGRFELDENDIRMAELLLKYGADINRKNKRGRTALFYAVSYRNWRTGVDFLLKSGADIQACDKKGISLLLYVATRDLPGNHCFPNKQRNDKTDTVELVEYLLRHGANPNFPDKKGAVPVMPATGELLRCLLENGANPSASDNLGRTAAMYHANIKSDLMLLLKFGADIHARDLQGNDVLLCADKNHEHIKFLIETFGFSADDRNDDGTSILHMACADMWPGTVKYLIRHGANPAARTKDGKTPLDLMYTRHFPFGPESDYGSSSGFYMVQRILERQLAVETAELFIACREMDYKRIRNAVERGASVRQVNRKLGKRTVLTIASERFANPGNGISWLRFLRIYLYLKKKGANILAVDAEGNCVLDALLKRNCQGAVEKFRRTVEKMFRKTDSGRLNDLLYYLKRKQDALAEAHDCRKSEAIAEIIALIEYYLAMR